MRLKRSRMVDKRKIQDESGRVRGLVAGYVTTRVDEEEGRTPRRELSSEERSIQEPEESCVARGTGRRPQLGNQECRQMCTALPSNQRV